MAKTKTKSQERTPDTTETQDSTASFEDAVVGVAQGISSTVSRNRVPILVAIVAFIAILGVYGLFNIYETRRNVGLNEEIFVFFASKTDEQIRSGYSKLLDDFKGARQEPLVALEICNWLNEQNQPGDREEALRVVRDVLGRHEGEKILALKVTELENAARLDASFTLPEPRAPEPETAIPLAPGADGAETPTTQPADGDKPGDDSPPVPSDILGPPKKEEGAGEAAPPAGDGKTAPPKEGDGNL